ncbi:MAG: hypothetical protein LWW87_04610 [Geobacteraceae bacterium]|nr:hypothetical protein [Geobacteraceae bacterium]
MKNYVFIIDTSYLLELFKVPGKFTDAAAFTIKEKFKDAADKNARFVVPFPCIFELANHIAHVADGGQRQTLSGALYNAVKSSLTKAEPWIIPPQKEQNELIQTLCQIFHEQTCCMGCGLTDTFIIEEAKHWKRKHNQTGYYIHIWSKDHNLKAFEPDHEMNPFTG